jgi:protein involved in polysaccharide export with SLBB domain
MPRTCRTPGLYAGGLALVFCLLNTGCQTLGGAKGRAALPLPRELKKVSLPPYVIEPPDILQVDAIRLVPKPPYRIEPLDSLVINVPEALQTEPIGGIYPVGPDGRVNLGFSYGSVSVAGMTETEARTAIENQLKQQGLKTPQAFVSLAQTRGVQQVAGPHLVRPDGTVGLGVYGGVRVTGMTIAEAKAAIEAHLAGFFARPEVSLDVSGYNSKVYYVVTDGAGFGETVARLPVTGNETVLDAVGTISGLSPVSSKHRIWIVRPSPDSHGCDQVLPVDWNAIVRRGVTATNYQILPGDRLYIQAQPLVTLDTYITKLVAPMERVFGFTLLGNSTVRTLKNTSGTGGTGIGGTGVGGF